jgi:YHS domain-containing protein
MTTQSTSATDPVCGMQVDVEAARAKGLTSTYQEQEYAFCGRGCKLEFDEGPERYLSPDHVPSM